MQLLCCVKELTSQRFCLILSKRITVAYFEVMYNCITCYLIFVMYKMNASMGWRVCRSIHKNAFHNKKFWKEIIAYFPWYDTGHIENDESSNSSIVACVFVTAVTFLPSRCLGTIGGNDRRDTRTDTETDGRDLWSTPFRWAHVSWYTYQV
jgi:hypothetical protein